MTTEFDVLIEHPVLLESERYRGPVLTPSPVLTTLWNKSSAATRRRASVDFAGRRIHFMGAGGIGVSALMELCAARGGIVSGCDCSSNTCTDRLKAKQIHVDAGHSPDHVHGCDEIVHTAAIGNDHPEIVRARSDNKVVRSRMNMLGQLALGTRAICVTGAHGKTTTTSMIAQILITAGRDPSVLVGGIAPGLNSNVRIGQGDEFVIETDESDNKLQEIIPSITVLTNIDNDHLENYGSVDNIQSALTHFMSATDVSDPFSALIGCADDVRVRRAMAMASVYCRRPVLSYGFDSHNTLRGINLKLQDDGMGWSFDALGPFGVWQDIQLPMPGRHNVLNALGAIAAAWHVGVDEASIRSALGSMLRVGRRFEIKKDASIRIVDDYGHHPTEIALTLKAARSSTKKRLGVLFQPHRYTRTATLMSQFATSFADADAVFLLPIYAASETPIEGVSHRTLLEAIRAAGHTNVRAFDDSEKAISAILKWCRKGDTIVTQGAGDVTKVSNDLASRL
ncbi:MAG: UDP-N-acetylmuramate--L-alanine ligase [Planctomycetota bacterium]